MPRTRIKICGIQRPQDAMAAAHAGVDAIGIILHRGSPRWVDVETARSIVRALPPYITPVGLFVDASADDVVEAAQTIGLHHIQLNGSESVAYAASLSHLTIFKAIRVDPLKFKSELALWTSAPANVRGIVLETPRTGVAGGSGVENDWDTAQAEMQAGSFKQLPVIAAGGLRPDNVASVIRRLHPWAVDVSSGVEKTRGEKSPEMIDAFVAAVTGVD